MVIFGMYGVGVVEVGGVLVSEVVVVVGGGLEVLVVF